ncbi:hypothetical protein SDRG_00325 [Saprolegnia diclina VS20]|uniref:Uncharacterized protein n=1 Tax=Saprolegnia diclina (strain VS20) TaxID=1156394 RepID=T0R6P8_SAPDV|nr:hypothetical protein SDRG_00325 [Saprolegnia diclina VS20]EQC42596.1 hypothetical protein SDRG_00325 [Saprolegnia diclina VS20]|eukprot:XP_008604019.1 hypothetical protein SDRG_00325 [Saprolegnia diclina VS20]
MGRPTKRMAHIKRMQAAALERRTMGLPPRKEAPNVVSTTINRKRTKPEAADANALAKRSCYLPREPVEALTRLLNKEEKASLVTKFAASSDVLVPVVTDEAQDDDALCHDLLHMRSCIQQLKVMTTILESSTVGPRSNKLSHYDLLRYMSILAYLTYLTDVNNSFRGVEVKRMAKSEEIARLFFPTKPVGYRGKLIRQWTEMYLKDQSLPSTARGKHPKIKRLSGDDENDDTTNEQRSTILPEEATSPGITI